MQSNWKARLFQLLFRLVAEKVAEVIISFSGSGDSGAIDTLEYFSQNEAGGLDKLEKCPLTDEEETELENIIYEYLETLGHNWYDNDGGHGEITIDVKERQISCEIYLASTTYDSHEYETSLVA